jgi:hypothetical protein
LFLRQDERGLHHDARVVADHGGGDNDYDAHHYGHQYEQLVATANAAGSKFNAEVKALPGSATGPDVAKIAEPVAAAIDAADQVLLRARWPATAIPGVRALVVADAVVIIDLRNLSAKDSQSIGAWGNQLAADFGNMKGQVDVVRADLARPPKSRPTSKV